MENEIKNESVLEKLFKESLSKVTDEINTIKKKIEKGAKEVKEFLDIDEDGRLSVSDAKGIIQLALFVGAIIFIAQLPTIQEELMIMITSGSWDWNVVNQVIVGQFISTFGSLFFRMFDKLKRVSKTALNQQKTLNNTDKQKITTLEEELKFIEIKHKENLLKVRYAYDLQLVEAGIDSASKTIIAKKFLNELMSK